MPVDPGAPGFAGAPLRPGEVTRLLGAWGGGDRAAADRLFALLYEELRRLAHRALADQRREATLQTTALVHELSLRLVGTFQPASDDRRRFFGAAAKVMRRILVDRARERLGESCKKLISAGLECACAYPRRQQASRADIGSSRSRNCAWRYGQPPRA